MNPIPLLIVEDNTIYAEILQRLLPTLGTDMKFATKCVDTAEKAMEELQRARYELVLLDYKLPGADGLTVLANIRNLPAATQPAVIMLTGMGREEIAVEAMKRGANDYLPKDALDVPSLLRAITTALERKRIEEALIEERNRVQALMENIPDTIYFKDTASRFSRINQAQAQLLGVPPEAAIGKTDFDFFTPEHAQAAYADEQKIIATGQPLLAKEEHIRQANGRFIWVSTTKVPLRDRLGNITGIVGVTRDITQAKEAEEQIAHYAEQVRDKNAQMEADLNMAREIQQALLPHRYPTFPHGVPLEASALRFHHRYQPTTVVGGDFFDVFELPNNQAGVFISDVMGHGVRAALVTAILRALAEELATVAADPGKFLTAMNRRMLAILRQTRMPMFASAFYLVADADAGEIRYAIAGHPVPLHVRRSAGTVAPLALENGKPGPALGVFEESGYDIFTSRVAPNDLVVMFTDGLFEAEGSGGELYGQARLRDAVAQRRQLATPELFSALLDEVHHFTVRRDFSDDVCLLGMDVVRIGR